MHSTTLRPFTLSRAALLLLLAATGCQGRETQDDASKGEGASHGASGDFDSRDGGSDAGACDETANLEPGSAVDPNDPCGTLLGEGEPLARAAWVSAPDPNFQISQAVGVTWFAEYAARVPLDPRDGYVLELERCETPADRATSCATSPLVLPADACGTGIVRFGVDPSQYGPGTNLYTFTVRLRRGCVVDSADTFSLTVEYDAGP
ncbi:hypothetical protein [Polyangium mundeleinium]|uniref:Lipoprotein n=1 Tax=Polyangium mundeleinium TaxID=2995306 RepID=A0ABT5F426_9BACT|nr:hypothetical protein [Polyangium mundeleinium]MDC0748252.1 hypothetical protein [Polyangium mundeleinium]